MLAGLPPDMADAPGPGVVNVAPGGTWGASTITVGGGVAGGSTITVGGGVAGGSTMTVVDRSEAVGSAACPGLAAGALAGTGALPESGALSKADGCAPAVPAAGLAARSPDAFAGAVAVTRDALARRAAAGFGVAGFGMAGSVASEPGVVSGTARGVVSRTDTCGAAATGEGSGSASRRDCAGAPAPSRLARRGQPPMATPSATTSSETAAAAPAIRSRW